MSSNSVSRFLKKFYTLLGEKTIPTGESSLEMPSSDIRKSLATDIDQQIALGRAKMDKGATTDQILNSFSQQISYKETDDGR